MDLSLDAPIQWDKKNGGLLNAPYDIKDKRAEHFSDLCNQASDIDLSIADDIDQHWIIKSMTQKQKRSMKLSTIQNLGGARLWWDSSWSISTWWKPVGVEWLLHLFNTSWDTEKIPDEWIDTLITILFKKGDRSQCGNYRGISLLSVVGKVFAGMSLQHLKWLAEHIYAKSQCGYHNGRGTIDGIFTLHQVLEKSREQRRGESFWHGQSWTTFHHTWGN